MAVYYSIYFIGVFAFLIHLSRLPKNERTKSRIIELLLLYQLIFSIGLTSLLSAIGFTFMKEHIAEFTGWHKCEFMQQMANVNLAFGVLGLMSYFYRGNFWLATILGFSVWIFADGIDHIYEAIVHNNYTAGNVGGVLVTDIVTPIVLVILLFLHRVMWPTKKENV